jgi:hypothetical protein
MSRLYEAHREAALADAGEGEDSVPFGGVGFPGNRAAVVACKHQPVVLPPAPRPVGV